MRNDFLDKNIRNFSIVAHIDHGKSTLADRFLELTGSIEKRKMRDQYLDQMDLERERGITIKLQPVRMEYNNLGSKYILNLIDTPGHIDFSYEVSRALRAVEGVILLVDATQGVQAQTFANADLACSLGLVIIPVINKIDLAFAKIEETGKEIASLLGCKANDVLEISAKTGEGVENLLQEIIRKVPRPQRVLESGNNDKTGCRALIFDFNYSPHQGVIAYCRVMSGQIKKGDELFLAQVKQNFFAQEVGFFYPELRKQEALNEGEIGYIVTNIKKPAVVRVGDTIISIKNPLSALPGYLEPEPVVWASIYPESQDDFHLLFQSLERLHLSDSSLSYEEEGSSTLGRGFKCGFLGMLHLEIVVERLKREFGLKIITASPSVVYSVHNRNGRKEIIYSPARFPDSGDIVKVFEPWVDIKMISPNDKLGEILKVLRKHEAEIYEIEQFGISRLSIKAKMALREFMRNFFDELKSVSAGYASLIYQIAETREADVGRLDILVADEVVPAFSRVVKQNQAQADAKELVNRLKNLLPKVLFIVKIQAKYNGRIIAAQSLSALKKDVTGYLYGGDRTRKMKLWQKQKAGKARLKQKGRVNIPHDVFLKMLKV